MSMRLSTRRTPTPHGPSSGTCSVGRTSTRTTGGSSSGPGHRSWASTRPTGGPVAMRSRSCATTSTRRSQSSRRKGRSSPGDREPRLRSDDRPRSPRRRPHAALPTPASDRVRTLSRGSPRIHRAKDAPVRVRSSEELDSPVDPAGRITHGHSRKRPGHGSQPRHRPGHRPRIGHRGFDTVATMRDPDAGPTWPPRRRGDFRFVGSTSPTPRRSISPAIYACS